MERAIPRLTPLRTAALLTALLVLRMPERCLALLLRLCTALRPLLLGVLFATVLSPAYERLRTDFSRAARRRGISADAGWIRGISLAGAILPALLVLTSIICVLIPQMLESVRMISENVSFYVQNLNALLDRWQQTALSRILPAKQLEAALAQLPERLPALLRITYDSTAAALRILLDIGIGAVFSLYLLADKPRLKAQIKVICRHMMQEARIQQLAARSRLTCAAFARFLTSQCKEALILGVLCWGGMTLLRFPYPVLISVIIGATNIVPYIGPLVGTVPSALLILLVQPRAALWFVVFIIVLQQIESNLIYPRIVGQSVGLPPAWVLAAIVIGGGLFGGTGMLLAVPAAAVLYALLISGESAQ